MPDFTVGSRSTLPLTVRNVGFLLDKLGQDCAPLQFLRELTQNSIEAIGRTNSRTGTIQWDVDWNGLELRADGVYKLALVDNGDGMTGEEMVKFINQLSSSISSQSLKGNFGVGAKVAAATRNHYGLIYLSWKDGQGAMIHLWRDPSTEQYGLRQFERSDGTFDYWVPIEDAIKPDIIQAHGTVVILLGNTAEEQTLTPPQAASSPSRWIAKYLNTRYFRFPDGVVVKAREGWEHPRSDSDRNLLRTITGQQTYLASHAEHTGTVPVPGALVHWWILRDEEALGQNSGFINSAGHIAALYRDELYEIQTGKAGIARLQQFGVSLGYKFAVIYVEPSEGTCELTANTARTHLMIDGLPLPWAEWGAEFRELMPAEIRSLVEREAAKITPSDHAESIRERLAQIRDLFRISRYRPTPSGDFRVDDEASRRGGRVVRETLARVRSGRSPGGGTGGRAGDIYATFAAEQGTPARGVSPDPFPRAIWVSSADDTRAEDYLEDRAAAYLLNENLIQINADFRVFTDMIERYCSLYGGVPGVKEVVVPVVREWFEQNLIEAVAGALSLEGNRLWSPEDLNAALSDEALTAVVMPRYHVDVSIRRALGTKLGSLKGQSSAPQGARRKVAPQQPV